MSGLFTLEEGASAEEAVEELEDDGAEDEETDSTLDEELTDGADVA